MATQFSGKDTPELDVLIHSLKNQQAFLLLWGNKIARQARENARAKGGRRFWGEIARSLRVRAVSDTAVEVGFNNPEQEALGSHKHYGGEIRAKNKQALTIPIAPEAKGRTAAEMSVGRKLFVVNGGSDGTGILGYTDGAGAFRALFALRKRVVQKPDPWWPPDELIMAFGIEAAEEQLMREARES